MSPADPASNPDGPGSVDKVLASIDVGLQSAGATPGERPVGQCWRCVRPAVHEVGLCEPCHRELADPATTASAPDDEDELTMVDVLMPGVLMSQVTGGEVPYRQPDAATGPDPVDQQNRVVGRDDADRAEADKDEGRS